MEPNTDNKTSFDSSSDKSIGPAIGIVIIILVVVIGSLYFWSQRIKQKRIPIVPIEVNSTTTAPTIKIEATTSTTTLP